MKTISMSSAKKVVLAVILSALLGETSQRALAEAPPVTCTSDPTAFTCVEYVRNYDADTITVNLPGTHPLFGREISVRVRGIDTPEIKGKNTCERDAAKSARDLVTAKLKIAKHIELRNVDRDKYFRILADVVVDGEVLSKTLLDKRLAYAYDGGTKQNIDWCRYPKTAHAH